VAGLVRPRPKIGKSSRGRTRGLPKINRAHIYRAHRAVIFAIAQLSCREFVIINKVINSIVLLFHLSLTRPTVSSNFRKIMFFLLTALESTCYLS